MDNKIYAYGYKFHEGDKGIVFSSSKVAAYNAVIKIYGKEYSENHKLELDKAQFMGECVFCIEDTWK